MKFVFTLVSTLALGMAGSAFAQTGGPANTTPTPANNSPALSSQAPATSQTPATMQENGQAQSAPVHLSANQIRQVQKQLKTAGMYKGAADGRMGTQTKQALQQFQQQNGLQATGQLDQQTIAALQNNQAGAGSNQVSTGSSISPNGSAPPNAGESNNNLNNSNPTNSQQHY